MKICADENVSPKLSALIREQLLGRDHTLHIVDDFEARGVDDQIWVRRFADAGGEAIIGGDAAMTTRPHELIAITECRLRLAILDQRWVRQKRHIQVAHLFFWWPAIERALVAAKPGTCLKVPWSWGETEGLIKPLKVDVQGAYAKARAAAKR